MKEKRIYIWLIGGVGFFLFNAVIATAMIDFQEKKNPREVEVLVSSTYLHAGFPLQSEQIERIRVPTKYLPDEAIRYDQAHHFVGQISRENIRPGMIILERDLRAPTAQDSHFGSTSPWSHVSRGLQHIEYTPEAGQSQGPTLSIQTPRSQSPRPMVRCGTLAR